MKNVSIYGKKWLDLVFEGKNKDYGAYQLRQENEKTSAIAFVFGITFLAGFVFLLSSFAEKTTFVITESPGTIVKVDRIYFPPKTTEPISEPHSVVKQTDEIKIPKGEMVVTVSNEATLEISTNAELPTTPPNQNGSITGTAPNTGNNATGTTVAPPKPDGPVGIKELDRLPNYPGGMKKFYEYVVENFDKETSEEGQTIKINVSFVIEKNGTMTDIKVIEKTNPVISKEAIRILKSIRTKWSPGYKDGEAVRAYFSLPITVLL